MLLSLLVLAITFVVGMIAPSWYIGKLFGQKNYFQPTRKGVLKLSGIILLSLICFATLFGTTITASQEERTAKEAKLVIEQQKKEESKKIAEQQAEEKRKADEAIRAEKIKQEQEEALRKAQEKVRQIENQISTAKFLDYREVSRNPSQYKGSSFYFRGKVIQSQSGNLLLMEERPERDWATNIIWVDYESSLSGGRILENDQLIIWGKYDGIHTYKTTGGGEKSVPSFTALKINLLN